MATEIIFLIKESPEGGFEAQGLDHGIFTEADSFDEIKDAIRDAVRCHFVEGERPALIRLHYVRDEVIAA